MSETGFATYFKEIPDVTAGDPAPDEAQDSAMNRMFETDIPIPPDEYLAFWDEMNGVSFEDIKFFATHHSPRIPGIVESNETYGDTPDLGGRVILGQREGTLFVYDPATEEYQEIERIDGLEIRSLESLGQMFSLLTRGEAKGV